MDSARANMPDDMDSLAAEMQEKGFVKLTNMFPAGILEAYKDRIVNSDTYREWLRSRTAGQGSDMPPMTKAVNAARVHFRNDSDLAEALFEALSRDASFRQTFTRVTGRRLLRTNSHVFEVATGDYSGLNWHVGYYSFSYTRPEDYGCTLWVPLDPVTPEQRGGMQYIPRDILDGAFLYRFASWHFDMLARMEPGEEYLRAAVSDDYMVNAISNLIDSSAPESQVLDYEFDVGDAFLFDKHVLHRSSPLLPGKLQTRMALICRFVDAEALYDRERFYTLFHHLEKSAASAGNVGASNLVGSAAAEPGHAAAQKRISPKDPFLAALAHSDSEHLAPIKSMEPIQSSLDARLLA